MFSNLFRKRVYLDYAGHTPLSSVAKKEMHRVNQVVKGNPGSIHAEGVQAKKVLTEARERIAKCIEASPNEIIFTSGCTEANNQAILGAIQLFKKIHPEKVPEVVTTAIEHKSVLEPVLALSEWGGKVTYLTLDKDGRVSPEEMARILVERGENVALVTVGYINNEIGTIQPIKEIGRVIRNYRLTHAPLFPIFHTDAAQAPGHVTLNVRSLRPDLASFTAQKFGGPVGIGFLYIARGVALPPLIRGGVQEFGFRAGTEPVSLIAGMASALTKTVGDQESEVRRLVALRGYAQASLRLIKESRILSPEDGSPHILNVSFPGFDGEQIVIELDNEGIAAATGSACTTGLTEPSHVIKAITGSEKIARGALRLSFGSTNSRSDIDRVIKCLRKVIKKQRTIASSN